MNKPRAQNGTAGGPRAVRLTFSYEGTEIKLEDQQPVETVVPPADTLSGAGAEQGFWIEIRGAQNETLYRRLMQDPSRKGVEVFPPNPEQNIFRAPVELPSGIFTVLVPDIVEADYVAVMRSVGREATGTGTSLEATPEGSPALAQRGSIAEIARFPLQPSGGGDKA